MPRFRIDCPDCGGDGFAPDGCDCGDDCCCCAEPTPPQCRSCRGTGAMVVSELTDDNCATAVPIDDAMPEPAR